MRSWAFHGGSSSPDASHHTQALVGAAAMMCGIATSSSRGSMPARKSTSLLPPSIDGQIVTALERAEDAVASAMGGMLRQHQHALERHGGPNPTRRAAASPAKPLDNLLHLPPEAAPVQEAINLVEDKPLKAAVCWSNSGRLSVFVRWLSRWPGVAMRRVMPLRSRAFSDLRFSPPKRHPGTIRGNKDRNSWLANECICVAGLRVGYKRAHHVPPDLPSAPAAPAPPPGEERRAPSVVGGGGKAMDYQQETRKHLFAVHLALHE